MPYGMPKQPQLLFAVGIACCVGLVLTYNLAHRLPSGVKAMASAPPRTPGQVLPVTATAKLADRLFELEIAKTRQQQAMGLMYRTFLPPNRGMLFPFKPPQSVKFWMKHCVMSLDMIFLREGKVIAIAPNTPPCKTDPCPVYGPNEPVDRVIEIRGGRATSIGLKVGDKVDVQEVLTSQ